MTNKFDLVLGCKTRSATRPSQNEPPTKVSFCLKVFQFTGGGNDAMIRGRLDRNTGRGEVGRGEEVRGANAGRQTPLFGDGEGRLRWRELHCARVSGCRRHFPLGTWSDHGAARCKRTLTHNSPKYLESA